MCVGERVVVERSVGLQVVGWGEVAGILVGPLLLERNAEQSDAPDLRVRDFEKVVDIGSLLNAIGQVEMRIVELLWCSLGSSSLRLGGKLNRPEKERGSDKQLRSYCEVSIHMPSQPGLQSEASSGQGCRSNLESHLDQGAEITADRFAGSLHRFQL